METTPGWGKSGENPVLSRNGEPLRKGAASPIAHQVRSRGGILLILLAFFSFAPVLPALADEFTLPPIIKESSPVDSLSVDPIVPSKREETSLSSGSGSVHKTLEDELPFSVTDPGRPGSLTQFRGLGDRAEDTNVQTLGIPLNYPQGGGFDFSSFPQFFWSDYRFTLSPSLSALDPRGASGTLALTPWTAKALGGADSRWTAMYAGTDLQQLSAATTVEGRAAILAGYSNGNATGPTGSISARVFQSDQLDLKVHLLGTRIDSQLYNFGNGLSPHQYTDRIIPVIQADWTASPQLLIKSSVFYDNTFIRYDDVSNAYYTRDRAQQVGAENALFYGDWKLGLSSRWVYYGGSAFYAPTERIANAYLARTFSWDTGSRGQFLLDPSIQGVTVTNFGTYPQASLGLREAWDADAMAVFFRGSYSRRFPSLQDRYYSAPGFGYPGILANPTLQPEDDLTYVLGYEGHQGIWSGSIQGYYQVRDNAEVSVPVSGGASMQQQNLGHASIASLIATGAAQITARAKIWNTLSWTHSRVDQISSPFPYVPNLVNIVGMGLEPIARLTIGADIRTQTSSFISSASGSLPGVAFGDVQMGYAWLNGLQVIGRAENVTGDPLVLSFGYPPTGRVLALTLIGPI